jgi:hypothetical protein
MADTVRDMVGYLRMQCPGLPYYLAQQMLRNRLRQVAANRNWSAMRAQTQILPNTATQDGTVTVTRGSAVVTGSGTSWTSAEVGRQFMYGRRAPVMTVLSVQSTTQLTLTEVFGGNTASAQPYQILDAYWTAPQGFKQFLVVLDPVNAWQLRFWLQQEDLARWDPQRTASGLPWTLVDLAISTTATPSPMFELWPYTLAQRVYVVRYYKLPDDLVNPDQEPMRLVRGDVLVKGAMVDVCRWPGTRDNPNLLFGKGMDRVYEAEYKDLLMDAEVEDENLMLTWLHRQDWAAWPYAPYDSRWLQAHA